MVNKKAKGKRSKTRSKLKRRLGKATVNESLRVFGQGDRIQVDIRPEIHAGMPAAIFQGCFGVVEGRQGNAYLVRVNMGNSKNTLVVNGIHLKQHGGSGK